MRKSTLAALVTGMFGGAAPRVKETVLRSQPKTKKRCLYCNKAHKHHNSFCSADHAKLWDKGERL